MKCCENLSLGLYTPGTLEWQHCASLDHVRSWGLRFTAWGSGRGGLPGADRIRNCKIGMGFTLPLIWKYLKGSIEVYIIVRIEFYLDCLKHLDKAAPHEAQQAEPREVITGLGFRV